MATSIQHYLQNLIRTPLFNFTTKKHVLILVFGGLAALLASFTVPLFSILLGEIFNLFTLFGSGEITGEALIQKVSAYCVALVGLGAAGWFCNAIYFVLFVVFGELQAAKSRDRLFEGLLKKDQGWFEAQEEGTRTFLGGLQIRVQELQMATSQPLGLSLQYSFRTLVSLGLAFYTSWNLSLVILAGIPIVSAIVPFLSPKIESSMEAQKEELTKASKVVNNAAISIDTVKCLNGQNIELGNFEHRVSEAASKYLRQALLNSLQISVMRFMMFGMFVQGFWYGSHLVISGRLSAGDVLRTFWACSTAAQSVEALLPQLIVLQKGKVAASSLQNALNDGEDDAPSIDTRGALYPSHCEGDIEVRKLSFAYPSQPSRLSLNSASFFFPAGATTFVIGKSGSGKSTLGQLLTRFYLPASGEILLDGIPMETLSINWVRNNITYVEQRSILFNESILKNIAFGRRDYEHIREDDVEKSINLAMLKTTIQSLPKGIDTCVGEGGNLLSGGQRQRVAIARARLRDTPILVLDEPTSALDGTNRIEVINAIREWRKGKTTIIITHDMAHIKESDFVYILDQGSVAQAGYKHELKSSEKYGELFNYNEENHSTADTFRKRYGNVGTAHEDSFFSDTSSTSSDESPYDQDMYKLSEDLELTQPPPLPKLLHVRRPWTSPQHAAAVNEVEIPMGDLSKKRIKRVRFEPCQIRASLPSHTYPSLLNGKEKKQKPAKDRRKPRTRISPEQHHAPIRRALQTVIPSLAPRQRALLFIGCLCTLIHASATPIFSYFLSQLLHTFYNKRNDGMRWALAVLGVSICDAFATYLMHYLLELCGQVWVDSLRKTAFRRVLDQPREWFEEERNSPSQISTCLYESGEEVRNLVSRFAGFVLIAAFVTLMAVVWSLAICWKLTFVALACGPIIYTVTRGFEKTSGVWDRRCTEARTTTSQVFTETFSEIRTVRSLTLEHYFHRKYLKAASKCLTIGLRKSVYTGLLFGLVESMIMFVSALIFYYGAALVRYQEFTVDNIMTVFSVLLFSIGYASTVVSWIPQISTSREMAKRLFRLVDLAEGVSHEHLGHLRISKTGPVRIRRLNFRYPSRPDARVLRNVSINIPQGSCTAIIGRSGSGKSTIASLLLSLYEVPPLASGDSVPTISLGGFDIRNIDTASLRSLVAIVSQQPTIFPATIQDNISYGMGKESPLSTLHSVRTAAKAAGIDEFIMSLPKGYLTVIGDGGIGLSGGQAQRLVIARALVRRPQILILDEATSSLDPNSADVIRQTIQRLISPRLGLTVIIIAHAREMMEIADNIIVLEQGSVVEEGRYEILAKKPSGKLKSLIEHQPSSDTLLTSRI